MRSVLVDITIPAAAKEAAENVGAAAILPVTVVVPVMVPVVAKGRLVIPTAANCAAVNVGYNVGGTFVPVVVAGAGKKVGAAAWLRVLIVGMVLKLKVGNA